MENPFLDRKAMAESSGSLRIWWIYSGIAMLVAIPIGSIYLGTAGMVNGEEFSPDDFSQRSFFYNKVPWIGTTLWGLTHSDRTSALQRRLIAEGLIQPTGSKIWHLIRDNLTDPNRSRAYDARILVAYLKLQDDSSNSYWDRWIDDHPKSARIFWPRVADLARHRLYGAIPGAIAPSGPDGVGWQDSHILGRRPRSSRERPAGRSVSSNCYRDRWDGSSAVVLNRRRSRRKKDPQPRIRQRYSEKQRHCPKGVCPQIAFARIGSFPNRRSAVIDQTIQSPQHDRPVVEAVWREPKKHSMPADPIPVRNEGHRPPRVLFRLSQGSDLFRIDVVQ